MLKNDINKFLKNVLLITRTRLDESGSSIARQNVVPEICEAVRNFKAQNVLTNNADMMQTRHKLTVKFCHGISEQVERLSLHQEAVDRGELIYQTVVGLLNVSWQ